MKAVVSMNETNSIIDASFASVLVNDEDDGNFDNEEEEDKTDLKVSSSHETVEMIPGRQSSDEIERIDGLLDQIDERKHGGEGFRVQKTHSAGVAPNLSDDNVHGHSNSREELINDGIEETCGGGGGGGRASEEDGQQEDDGVGESSERVMHWDGGPENSKIETGNLQNHHLLQERSGQRAEENSSMVWVPQSDIKTVESDTMGPETSVYWNMMPPEEQQQREDHEEQGNQEETVEEDEEDGENGGMYPCVNGELANDVVDDDNNEVVDQENTLIENDHGQAGNPAPPSSSSSLPPLGTKNLCQTPGGNQESLNQESLNQESLNPDSLTPLPIRPPLAFHHPVPSMRSLLRLHVSLDDHQVSSEILGQDQNSFSKQILNHEHSVGLPVGSPGPVDEAQQSGHSPDCSSGHQLSGDQGGGGVLPSPSPYWPWYSANPPPPTTGSTTTTAYPNYTPPVSSYPYATPSASFPYHPYPPSGVSPFPPYTPASTPVANVLELKGPPVLHSSSQPIQQKLQKQATRKNCPLVHSPSPTAFAFLQELLPNLCTNCQSVTMRLSESSGLEKKAGTDHEELSKSKGDKQIELTAFMAADAEKPKGSPRVMVLAPEGYGKRRRGPRSKDGGEWNNTPEGPPILETDSADGSRTKGNQLADLSTVKRPVMFVSWETFSRVGRNAVDMELHAQDCRKARDVQRSRDELRENLKAREEEIRVLRATMKKYGLKDPTKESPDSRSDSAVMGSKKTIKKQLEKILALRKNQSRELSAMDVASLDLETDSEESGGGGGGGGRGGGGGDFGSSSSGEEEGLLESENGLRGRGRKKGGGSKVRGSSGRGGGRGRGGRGRGRRGGKGGQEMMGGSLENEIGEGFDTSYVTAMEETEAGLVSMKRKPGRPSGAKDKRPRKRTKFVDTVNGTVWIDSEEVGMIEGDLDTEEDTGGGMKEEERDGGLGIGEEGEDGEGLDEVMRNNQGQQHNKEGVQDMGVRGFSDRRENQQSNEGQLTVRGMGLDGMQLVSQKNGEEELREGVEDEPNFVGEQEHGGESEEDTLFDEMEVLPSMKRRFIGRRGGKGMQVVGREEGGGDGVDVGKGRKEKERAKKEKVKRLSMTAKEREDAREAKRRAKARPPSGGQLIGVNGLVVFESRVPEGYRPSLPNFLPPQGTHSIGHDGTGNMLPLPESQVNMTLERLDSHGMSQNVGLAHLGFADGDPHIERSQGVGLESVERGGGYHMSLVSGHDEGRRTISQSEGWERDPGDPGVGMGGGGGGGGVLGVGFHRNGEEDIGHEFNNLGYVPHGSVTHGSVTHGSVPHGSVAHGSVPHGSVPHGSVPHVSVPHGSVIGRYGMTLTPGLPGVGFQGWSPHIDPRGILHYGTAEELMRQGHHLHHVGRNSHHGY